jgi:hypothetical protein
VDAALLKTSPDGRSYKARIDSLRTEKQMNALFDDMISELPGQNPARRLQPGPDRGPDAGQRGLCRRACKGKVLSLSAARQRARRSVHPPRRALLRHRHPARLPGPYSQPLYRFADFNAGRYSSRNAAFQEPCPGSPAAASLALDGDLLRYTDGVPAAEPSATLSALQPSPASSVCPGPRCSVTCAWKRPHASPAQPLYSKVFALADSRAGTRLPREAMPRIDLKSPKIQRKLTTAWFADRVDTRHRTCLGRNRSASP